MIDNLNIAKNKFSNCNLRGWGLYEPAPQNTVTSFYEPVSVPTPGNREHTIVGHGPTHGAEHVTPASAPSIQCSTLPKGTLYSGFYGRRKTCHDNFKIKMILSTVSKS